MATGPSTGEDHQRKKEESCIKKSYAKTYLTQKGKGAWVLSILVQWSLYAVERLADSKRVAYSVLRSISVRTRQRPCRDLDPYVHNFIPQKRKRTRLNPKQNRPRPLVWQKKGSIGIGFSQKGGLMWVSLRVRSGRLPRREACASRDYVFLRIFFFFFCWAMQVLSHCSSMYVSSGYVVLEHV